jgi:NAD(P)-dependent dehydrogenase (short-subunit alcohol dehydrogenase family)
VRNSEKGNAAKARILEETSYAGELEVWELDMASFASVTSFAARAKQKLPRLDGAVLNAGIHIREWRATSDGWEETLVAPTLIESVWNADWYLSSEWK